MMKCISIIGVLSMLDINDNDLSTLTGRSIVSAEYSDPNQDNEWSDHGEYRITLDDGRVLVFDSIGYDASQVHMIIEESDG